MSDVAIPIVNRERELSELARLAADPPALVVLRGRRRVGKSRIEVGSWWSRKGDAEIDMVAMGKDRYVVLGSCKWRKGEVGADVLDQLYAHRALLGPKAARARLALFARHAFTAEVRRRAEQEDVALVTTPDLFA